MNDKCMRYWRRVTDTQAKQDRRIAKTESEYRSLDSLCDKLSQRIDDLEGKTQGVGAWVFDKCLTPSEVATVSKAIVDAFEAAKQEPAPDEAAKWPKCVWCDEDITPPYNPPHKPFVNMIGRHLCPECAERIYEGMSKRPEHTPSPAPQRNENLNDSQPEPPSDLLSNFAEGLHGYTLDELLKLLQGGFLCRNIIASELRFRLEEATTPSPAPHPEPTGETLYVKETHPHVADVFWIPAPDSAIIAAASKLGMVMPTKRQEVAEKFLHAALNDMNGGEDSYTITARLLRKQMITRCVNHVEWSEGMVDSLSAAARDEQAGEAGE